MGDTKPFSATQLAERIGASKSSIYRWVAEGMPHFRTRGGHLRFDPYDVRDWLEAAVEDADTVEETGDQ